jgi:hypothetical protein
MSDNADREDTVRKDAQTAATAGAAPAGADTAQPKLYAGKYDSPEKLATAYEELQRHATKEAQRAAEAEKSANEARMQAEIAKQIAAQTQAQAQQPQIGEAEEIARLETEWERTTDEWRKPGKAIVDGMKRSYTAVERLMSEREAKLKKEFEARLGEVEVAQSDEYRQNAKQIEVLAKRFGSRKAALEAFKELAAVASFVPEGAPAPGSTAPSRPAGGATREKTRQLTDAEVEKLAALTGTTLEEARKDPGFAVA